MFARLLRAVTALSFAFVQSWDAKFGKTLLREELEEAVEKIAPHEKLALLGFITSEPLRRKGELEPRVIELQKIYGIEIRFDCWKVWTEGVISTMVRQQMGTEEEVVRNWLYMYCDYLGQKRRDVAPIDEPCYQWVDSLIACIKSTDF